MGVFHKTLFDAKNKIREGDVRSALKILNDHIKGLVDVFRDIKQLNDNLKEYTRLVQDSKDLVAARRLDESERQLTNAIKQIESIEILVQKLSKHVKSEK